jgi:putative Ca2+/H+ antiporter (TMEM165/GDT1 family)
LIEVSFAAFTAAFLLVLVAEMGDKTQFIAMTFATKFNPYKVLVAIFLATIANFAIVVAIGQLITAVIPLDIISLAASLSFIGFGLWTLREEKEESGNLRASRFGVVAAVGISFFIAEFGDKTQLTTLSLAARYQSPISVLVGATLAMLVADGIGIIIGVVFCKRLPQRTLMWLSAAIFVLFGLVGVYEVLPAKIGLLYTTLVLAALAAFSLSIMLVVAWRQKARVNEKTEKKACERKNGS